MPTLHRVGKNKVVSHHHDVPFRVLDKGSTFRAPEGLPANSTDNRIIHNDNLKALKSLLPLSSGVVCIRFAITMRLTISKLAAGRRPALKAARPAVALLMAALAACSTAPLPPLSLDVRGQPHQMARDGGVNVALADGGAERVDRLYLFGHESRIGFKTGEQWLHTFIGAPNAAPGSLRIIDSRLENTIIAAGFAATITYTVSAALVLPAGEFPLRAEASESYGFDQESAVRVAVDGAITSMASQASAILKKQAPVSADRPAVEIAERLRELTKLFKDGTISEREYESKKQQLMNAL